MSFFAVKPRIIFEQKNFTDSEFLAIVRCLTQSSVQEHYPCFSQWVFLTFRNEMFAGKRSIIVARDADKIAGISLLKNTAAENKICAFYIPPPYRKMRIGQVLMEKSLSALNEQDVKISASAEVNAELYPFLNGNGFTIEKKINGYYRENIDEYFYRFKN